MTNDTSVSAEESVGRRALIRGGATLGLAAVPLLGSAAPAHAATTDSRLVSLWAANRSKVGLPISAPIPVAGGICQEFQFATMFYSSATGAAIIHGKVRETYFLGGGPSTMGFPIAKEIKSPHYPSCYTQKASLKGSDGQLWWSRSYGGIAVPAVKTIRLPGAANFRDASGEGAGLEAGSLRMRRDFLFRSPQTGSLPPFSRFVLQSLGITKIISLGGSDTAIPGIMVDSARIKNLSADTASEKRAMYRNYVTSRTNRESVGKALTAIATSTEPVMIHCAAGKDRTGWITALVHFSLGVRTSTVFTEYLKSNSYTDSNTAVDESYLEAGLDQVKASYGSVGSYLTSGCGVTSSTLSRLRNRLLV